MESGLFQGVRFLRLAISVERASAMWFSEDVGVMGEAVRNDLHFRRPC